jgi:hypothetical protein
VRRASASLASESFFFSALSALIALACGTTNVTNVAACGAGTKLVNGVCVADVSGGMDAGGGVEGDSGEPATGDAGVDADPNALLPGDDPCPTGYDAGTVVFNCDPKCGATHPDCEVSRCRKAGETRVFTWQSRIALGDGTPSSYTDFVLRLPRDPWTVYGECDPSLVPPLHPTLGTAQYSAIAPAPRWAFALPILEGRPDRTTPWYFNYAPDPYQGIRIAWEGEQPPSGYPFDPLGTGGTMFSSGGNPPCQVFSVTENKHLVALYTSLPSVPAHNFLFKQASLVSLVGVTCK